MTAPDTVPPHPRIVTTPTSLRRNEAVSRGVTAPRLTVDHARSFEVPCLFDGRPATLLALRLRHFGDGWLVALAGRVLYLAETPDALLGHGWHSSGIVPPAQFDSAQEAVDAAFATDQIEPRGDQK